MTKVASQTTEVKTVNGTGAAGQNLSLKSGVGQGFLTMTQSPEGILATGILRTFKK